MKSNGLLSATLLGALSVGGVAAGKLCQDYKIPITITTENEVFGLPRFQDNFDVADFIDTISSRTPPIDIFTGSVNETASYTIAATFCSPDRGALASHKSTVLIATHGLNYDRGQVIYVLHISNQSLLTTFSYWHPRIQSEKYSFVDYAVGRGYSILYYDRLGVGESTQ